jgi:hypothetical protein
MEMEVMGDRDEPGANHVVRELQAPYLTEYITEQD